MASLKQQIHQISARIVKAAGRSVGFTRFKKMKQFILKEVERHPVCEELRQHQKSQFLPTGTLFGFMGFNEGDDPVGALLTFLDKNIVENNIFLERALKSLSVLELPSFSEMASEPGLQLPWLAGISWPEAIEEGVSGLQHFLSFPNQDGYVPPRSLSGEGLQAKARGKLVTVRSDDMLPVPFLTPIFTAAAQIK